MEIVIVIQQMHRKYHTGEKLKAFPLKRMLLSPFSFTIAWEVLFTTSVNMKRKMDPN